MARSRALVFVVLMVCLLGLFLTSSEGRKNFMVLKPENNSNNNKGDRSNTMRSAALLFLGALPKGKVPSSAPSKKGHADVIDEKLIARHLIAIDRSLRSVPSPGVGH